LNDSIYLYSKTRFLSPAASSRRRDGQMLLWRGHEDNDLFEGIDDWSVPD
jgi:hypothetical protein